MNPQSFPLPSMAPGAPAAAAAATASVSGLEDLLPTDDDLLYEEELLRNPFSLKMWWRYIEARKHVSLRRRHLLYERALKSLPGSYKVLSLSSNCCTLPKRGAAIVKSEKGESARRPRPSRADKYKGLQQGALGCSTGVQCFSDHLPKHHLQD